MADSSFEVVKWIVGTGVAVGGVVMTTLIGAFRNLSARVSRGDAELHRRVDQVRDDYVRRDDYHRAIADLKTDLRGINTKLDQLIDRTGNVSR